MLERKIVVVLVLCFLNLIGVAQTKIILKLDDLGSKNGQVSAPAALKYLKDRKIKASLGVIANRLDESAKEAYQQYLTATNDKGEKLIEIWNHGFDHSNNIAPGDYQEFKGTPYSFQSKHLDDAHNLVEERLALKMQSFGSPFNASDTSTVRALQANGNYKVFMFSGSAEKIDNILTLNNRVNMEITTGKVDFENFLLQYQKYKDTYKDYMVLQGHPNIWDEENLAQFDRVINYLIAQNCEFVLPMEYYNSITGTGK